MTDSKVWRPVSGYEGSYSVSDEARREIVFLSVVEKLSYRAIGRLVGVDHKSVAAVVARSMR